MKYTTRKFNRSSTFLDGFVLFRLSLNYLFFHTLSRFSNALNNLRSRLRRCELKGCLFLWPIKITKNEKNLFYSRSGDNAAFFSVDGSGCCWY